MGGKTFKTFTEQAQILRKNGCSGDLSNMASVLASVNYYRLSAYWYPFRKTNPDYNPSKPDSRPRLDEFTEGTTFRDVIRFYDFDHALKSHVFKAIERIEVAFRTKTAYYWCASRKKKYNPQEELDAKFLEDIQYLYERSKDECVRHQKNISGILHVKDLPVWVFVELTTFAHLQTIYGTFEDSLRTRIAQAFGFKTINSFRSSMALIREARNVCAHYARFWNKSWTLKAQTNKSGLSVKTPFLTQNTLSDILKHSWNENTSAWETHPVPGNQKLSLSKTASVLVIIAELDKKITGTSAWAEELVALIKSQKPDTGICVEKEMGLVGDWEKHPSFLPDN